MDAAIDHAMILTWHFGLILPIWAACMLSCRGLVHYFQLESYQFPGFFRTLLRNVRRAVLPGAVVTAVGLVCMLVFEAEMKQFWPGVIITALAILGTGVWVRGTFRDEHAKKKLVYTARIKRLYAVAGVLWLALLVVLALVSPWLVWPMVLFPLLLPLWVALAGLLAWPIEKLISEMYFRDAQRILGQRPDLIKIGITGSYGKTSVKFILGTLLSEKYQTLVTPSSFNTPMGVTKIIRTKLLPAHQVFVAEMGARHVGDIKEMCRLVHPTYGVLTSVGPQHLDTFKTIDRIKSTKYELMDALPESGCCFFPDDGAICRELYDRTTKEKRLCSLAGGPDADVWAEQIRVSPAGSSFELCTREGRVSCETRLLGEHNIQNVLLAATVCLRLGLTLRQIARGIAKLEPVEHRLQLLSNPGGMTIIDDAFNSNPRGAEAALKVLAQFPERRIIITPGMVELGEKEADFNRAFGEKMAGSVDIAILVGKKHTKPIAEGLLAAGFDEASLHPVSSLDEATALLGQLGRAGDTVLFENDLPDHYAE